MVDVFIYKYVVSPLLRKIAEEMAFEELTGMAYLNRNTIKKVLNKLKKYGFRIGKYRCMRSNKLAFDIFLQRWVVKYTCLRGTRNIPRYMYIDLVKEEEIVRALDGNKEYEYILDGDPLVFIPRPDVFAKMWINADLLEGTSKMANTIVRAVWGFTDDKFVNRANTHKISIKSYYYIPMITIVEGVVAVYNALPKFWYMCMPIKMKVIRGPDKGEEMHACVTVGDRTIESIIMEEVDYMKYIFYNKKMKREETELDRELKQLLLKEVLHLETGRSQGPGTQGSSKVSGGSTGRREPRGLERFLRSKRG